MAIRCARCCTGVLKTTTYAASLGGELSDRERECARACVGGVRFVGTTRIFIYMSLSAFA